MQLFSGFVYQYGIIDNKEFQEFVGAEQGEYWCRAGRTLVQSWVNTGAEQGEHWCRVRFANWASFDQKWAWLHALA